MAIIDDIREKMASSQFEFSQHAVDQSIVRHISIQELREAIAVGDMIVVMSARPARVLRIIPVDAADRNRASAAFAHKLGETLECLGVTQ